MIYLLTSILGQGYSASVVLAFVLAYIFAITLAFGLHEYAHAFTAYKLGDPTPKALGRLTLNPLKHLDVYGLIGFLLVGFGWAKPVQINPLNFKKYKRDMFLVSISGVVTNIILAFIFSGGYFFFTTYCGKLVNGVITYSNSLMYFFHYFLQYSVILNIALFIFNLIPVYPLDGFNAVRSFTKYNNKFVNFMYKFGNIIMLFIIITPIFDILYSFITENILSVFFNFWRIFI